MEFIKAKKIFSGDLTSPNLYLRAKCVFPLDKIPRRALLRIRANGRYQAALNGEDLDCQQYADYESYPVVDEYPIDAGKLHTGDNLFTVLVNCQNEDSSMFRKEGLPSVIFEIEADGKILLASGEDTDVTTDTGFETGAGVEKISPQLSYSFRYDARVPARAVYTKASVLPDEKAPYRERPIPQLRVLPPREAKIIEHGDFLDTGAHLSRSGERMAVASLKARPGEPDGAVLPSACGVTLEKLDTGADGVYLLVDLGEECAGYLELDLDASCGTKIDGGFGEHIADGRVRTKIGGRNFAYTVTADGRTKLTYRIKRFGCRYLSLHIRAEKCTVYALTLREALYPVDEIRHPKGMTELQTKLYNVAVRTLLCCMHEHYEDCPWREQSLYAMDSRNQMLFGYDAFGETRMAKASLRLLALGMREDGLLELCAPARVSVDIPSFSLIYLVELAEYGEKTKDTEFLREMLPTVRTLLSTFARFRREDGLLVNPVGYWNFFEWAPEVDGVLGGDNCHDGKCEAPLNAFYKMALDSAASIFSLLGDEKSAKEISAQAEALAAPYERAFFDPDRRAYRLGEKSEGKEYYHELVEVLTLASGLGKTHAKDLIERLLSGEFFPKVTLSHRIFFYDVLLRYGYEAEALADMEAHFTTMLDAGATTFWETEEGSPSFDEAGSLCHGWSAAPVYVLFRALK